VFIIYRFDCISIISSRSDLLVKETRIRRKPTDLSKVTDTPLSHNFVVSGIMVINPFSTIFQVYSGGQFYWWKKPVYPEKTTDLSQVTGKL